jgi:hypothetical protein
MKKLLVSILLSGCFDSSVIDNVRFRCSNTYPDCPVNRVCFIQPQDKASGEGWCEKLIDITDPTTDLTGGTIVNDLSMTRSDMTSADMSFPPDLRFPSTCKAGGGTSLGDGSFVCTGTWDFISPSTFASSLCTVRVCPSLSPSAKTVCDNINGFYFGDVGGGLDYATRSVFECASHLNGGIYLFYGCGKGGLVSNITCKGFNGYLSCDPASSFTCVPDISTINNSKSNRPQTGVVCCP